LNLDLIDGSGHLLRGKLVCKGKTRSPRDKTKLFLLRKSIYFIDNTINVIRQAVAQLTNIFIEREKPICPSDDHALRADR